MDLWIRSQTRIGLISAKLIYVRSALRVKGEEKKDVYQVIASDEIVAEYSTKERALEVLDEIQKILTPQIFELMRKVQKKDFNCKDIYNVYAVENCQTGEVDIKELSTIVYQMPKEWLWKRKY